MSGETESELLDLAKQGDLHAFETLYRTHVGKIYALCLRMCGNTELAEDLTQESFIRAWQKLDGFRGDAAFSSWLYRLSSNVVIGHLRQRKNWALLEFDEHKHQAALGSTRIVDERPDIETLLAHLPGQARVVVILYEYLGYKHSEIARLTGIAVGTSKSLLYRARKQLQAGVNHE